MKKFCCSVGIMMLLVAPLHAADDVKIKLTDAIGVSTCAVQTSAAATVAGFDSLGRIVSGNASKAGTIVLSDGSDNSITITAPSIGSDYTLTLPTTGGNNGEVLKTAGSGVTSWTSPIKFIAKTADENVNNSTALQNDDALFFTMEAGKTYIFAFRLLVNNASNAGPDWKAAVSAGATCSALVVQSGSEPLGAVFLQTYTADVDAAPGTLVNSTILTDSGVPFNVWIQGWITDDGNARTVNLQWAQNSATVCNLTVKMGSYLIVQKVD